VTAYNYEHFDAPDGELSRLDGERARLSELWRQQGLVLEFGSFT
jgi:hypothetical protein